VCGGKFMQRKYTSKIENNKGIIRKGRYKKKINFDP
jgi:hypothetical protein